MSRIGTSAYRNFLMRGTTAMILLLAHIVLHTANAGYWIDPSSEDVMFMDDQKPWRTGPQDLYYDALGFMGLKTLRLTETEKGVRSPTKSRMKSLLQEYGYIDSGTMCKILALNASIEECHPL
ncbi:uncharacterized protein LOC142564613 isoform X2 [Dermacentor variabilis]|uniref:uncharacterized protein LOC142564613 isoform X2 n=1 Tax=Dermacentor variabilis TaxID=34621 RepID=UPI003F5C162A